MGTFVGHVLPGFVLILFGIWHVVQFVRSYFRHGKKKFMSNTYYSGATCWGNRLPCESVLKIVVTVIHFIMEFITGFRGNEGFVNWGNTQHMAMTSLFCFQGIVEILIHNDINIPSKMNYVALIMAFIFEAFVFSQHLHGREMVDTQMHISVVVLALMGAIFLSFEMQHQNSITLTLVARFVLILQGSWLIEMGFVIFPPKYIHTTWNMMDHNYTAWLSATLGFQAGFIMFLILLMWLFFAKINGQFVKENQEYNIFDEKGYRLLSHEDDNCDTS